jgi:predicted Rdx family selenoprotein
MAEILGERELEYNIRSFKLIPSEGGAFEINVGGELIYSKRETKRHLEAGEGMQMISEKIHAIIGS